MEDSVAPRPKKRFPYGAYHFPLIERQITRYHETDSRHGNKPRTIGPTGWVIAPSRRGEGNTGLHVPILRLHDQPSPGNAIVLSNAFSAWRESSLVCCTTIGASASIMLAKSVSRGIGSGSWRSLKRRCLVRRAETVSR